MSSAEIKSSDIPQARFDSNTDARTHGKSLRTADMFGKKREIAIEHAGVYYRLRITRANKLILTK